MPTEDELIINSIIFNECNHPDHTTETIVEGGYDRTDLICTVCGLREWFSEYDRGDYKDSKLPSDYMKKCVPPHCLDIITTRKVVRQLEKHGWKSSISIRNGKYKVNFTKGEQSYLGEEKSNEHEAICSAAVLLAKSLNAPL